MRVGELLLLGFTPHGAAFGRGGVHPVYAGRAARTGWNKSDDVIMVSGGEGWHALFSPLFLLSFFWREREECLVVQQRSIQDARNAELMLRWPQTGQLREMSRQPRAPTHEDR